jgi:hypothetical protein
MLREHGAAVWAHDVDIVRQDWFKMIAFGGFRLVADDESVAQAQATLAQYRDGSLALAEDDADVCPKCSKARVAHDPQPRRNVFLALIFLWLVPAALLLSLNASTTSEIMAAFALQVPLYLSLPWLAIAYFKWRLRCTDCGFRWRERPQPHAELTRMATAAAESA